MFLQIAFFLFFFVVVVVCFAFGREGGGGGGVGTIMSLKCKCYHFCSHLGNNIHGMKEVKSQTQEKRKDKENSLFLSVHQNIQILKFLKVQNCTWNHSTVQHSWKQICVVFCIHLLQIHTFVSILEISQTSVIS